MAPCEALLDKPPKKKLYFYFIRDCIRYTFSLKVFRSSEFCPSPERLVWILGYSEKDTACRWLIYDVWVTAWRCHAVFKHKNTDMCSFSQILFAEKEGGAAVLFSCRVVVRYFV